MTKQKKIEKNEKWKTITTPSAFGSHRSMVVPPPEGVELAASQCVCKDDDGLYITQIRYLDNGLADPHRYSQNWRLHV